MISSVSTWKGPLMATSKIDIYTAFRSGMRVSCRVIFEDLMRLNLAHISGYLFKTLYSFEIIFHVMTEFLQCLEFPKICSTVKREKHINFIF